jgi:Putative phage metallopeptidase
LKTIRPDFSAHVGLLIEHVAHTMPEFKHLVPSAILVVAGEARRGSRATVKPLAFSGGRRSDALGRKKPLVRVEGRRILYCVTLRPLFFRDSSPRERVATVLHELFHISRDFDGTLEHAHTHAELGRRFESRFQPLEKRLWKYLPEALRTYFSFDGEVRVLQWLERPAGWLPGERASHRRLYTEAHLFHGVVRLKGKKKRKKSASGGPPAVH